MRRNTLITAVSAACLALACAASAHEFWVQPDHSVVDPGGLVRVHLFHGERFQGDPVRRNDGMIDRYEFIANGHDPVEVRGMHGAHDGFLRPDHAGVIVYHTKHYMNNLPADRFDSYLREEGLAHIIDERAELGESEDDSHETYTRCAKSIILMTGTKTDPSAADMDAELPLEIMLDSVVVGNGTRTVTAAVSFNDEPLENQQVIAVSTQAPTELVKLTTDSKGHVSFSADHTGDWMITTLYMRRADDLEDASWESFWGSLTFPIVGQ